MQVCRELNNLGVARLYMISVLESNGIDSTPIRDSKLSHQEASRIFKELLSK